MKKKTFLKAAGIIIMLTGTGHSLTHLSMSFAPSPFPELSKLMSSTTVNMMKEISILDFHNGFSLAMGVLLIGFGFQVTKTLDKVSLLFNLIVCSLLTFLSFLYFPPFVIVLLSISTLSLLIHTLKYDS